MTEPEGMKPEAGPLLRGRFVRFPEVGATVEGIVTYVDLKSGATTMDTPREPIGVVQIYDPSVGDQGEGDHGFYRRVSLEKRALRNEVERCVRSGLKEGWHLRLTYAEDVPNKDPNKFPWKRFKSNLAEPTLSANEVTRLVAEGKRAAGEGANGSAPAAAPAAAPPGAPAAPGSPPAAGSPSPTGSPQGAPPWEGAPAGSGASVF